MSILFIEDAIDLHSSRCMFDPNFMALAFTVPKIHMVKYVKHKSLTKKLQSQQTVKSRSRLNADGGSYLYSSRCMHDPNFMALAHIASEKMI